jgi:hypothetical protein
VIDTRLAIFMLWGGGTVITFGMLLVRRWHRFQVHRSDRRRIVRVSVRHDVLSAVALFLTAFGSAASIFMILFGEAGSTPRSFALALALGAFLGAGLVMLSEDDVEAEG